MFPTIALLSLVTYSTANEKKQDFKNTFLTKFDCMNKRVLTQNIDDQKEGVVRKTHEEPEGEKRVFSKSRCKWYGQSKGE